MQAFIAEYSSTSLHQFWKDWKQTSYIKHRISHI